MKKILFIFLLSPLSSFCQDTVCVSNTKSTYLMFPKDIKSYQISTKDLFIVSNIVEGKPNVLSMIATKTRETDILPSNLFVVLKNGQTFYLDIVPNFNRKNYLYDFSDSKTNSHQYKTETITYAAEMDNNANVDSDSLALNPIYESIMKRKKYIMRAQKKRYDIIFDVHNVVYHNNKIFVKVSLENKTNIDYDVDFFTFFRANKDDIAEKTDFKEMVMDYLDFFKERKDLILKPNEKRCFIFTFNQFTLTDEEQIIFALKEKFGERRIYFNIPYYFINYSEKY